MKCHGANPALVNHTANFRSKFEWARVAYLNDLNNTRTSRIGVSCSRGVGDNGTPLSVIDESWRP